MRELDEFHRTTGLEYKIQDFERQQQRIRLTALCLTLVVMICTAIFGINRGMLLGWWIDLIVIVALYLTEYFQIQRDMAKARIELYNHTNSILTAKRRMAEFQGTPIPQDVVEASYRLTYPSDKYEIPIYYIVLAIVDIIGIIVMHFG